jgi:hypothetical protein
MLPAQWCLVFFILRGFLYEAVIGKLGQFMKKQIDPKF